MPKQKRATKPKNRMNEGPAELGFFVSLGRKKSVQLEKKSLKIYREYKNQS